MLSMSNPIASQQIASPFVVGRPLKATEPIFGRESIFNNIASNVSNYGSTNIVGERRMGKTSIIIHLVNNPTRYLPDQSDQPPLVIAQVDLQRDVHNANRFYGLALRELLDRLPPSRSQEARALATLHERLKNTPEATYDEFDRVLRQLHDPSGIQVRPVLVIDEFERLLNPTDPAAFPYPDFFNNLRSLMTAGLLALIVASREPLINYFTDPNRPNGLTSTFPSYCMPLTLELLDESAADTLLLQPSNHKLAPPHAELAKRWAKGHPCKLQAAGAAWYQAKVERRPPHWIKQRYQQLIAQNCTAPTTPQPSRNPIRLIWQGIVWIVTVPSLFVGRIAKLFGKNISEATEWIVGTAIIVLFILLLLKGVEATEVGNAILNVLGLNQ